MYMLDIFKIIKKKSNVQRAEAFREYHFLFFIMARKQGELMTFVSSLY